MGAVKTEIKLLIAGVLLFLTILWAGNRFAAGHGADTEQLKQSVQETKAGEKTLARANVVYQQDTIKLTKEILKYRTIRDTLVITDTLVVRAALDQADSTINACLVTVLTCEAKDSAHKIIEAGLRKQNDALRHLVPGRTERFISALKWAAVGAVVGYVAK